MVDKAIDAAHEYLRQNCKVEDQSSKENTHNDSRQSSDLKLRWVELPKFNGDVLKFQNFWDRFEVVVYDIDDLPKVQKFDNIISSEICYQDGC